MELREYRPIPRSNLEDSTTTIAKASKQDSRMSSALFLSVFVFALAGAARGFDEGSISGLLASPDFRLRFGLEADNYSKSDIADIEGTIAAMVQLASIAGALVASFFNDRMGRVWALRELCILWILGVAVQINAPSIQVLYLGRFLSGLGIGQTTVVCPTYIAEVAPSSIRGMCTCMFSAFVYLGIMSAYIANYGSSLFLTGWNRWIVPLVLQIGFAGICLVVSFFAIESPRQLIAKGDTRAANKALSKLRNIPQDSRILKDELEDIQTSLARDAEIKARHSLQSRIFEIIGTKENRYKLMLGVMVQILGQWSGANSITLYAPKYLALLGVTKDHDRLLLTAIFGVLKFVAALSCAFFLVDRIGRKKSLYIGVTLQCLSMALLAVVLGFKPKSEPAPTQSWSRSSISAMGGVLLMYTNGLGWAIGWNSIQYLINAEIYPLHLRSLGTSIIMCFHFSNQFGNSRVVPKMLLDVAEGGVSPGGTMGLFAGVCALGIVWIYYFLPETAGRSLEGMDELFRLPWWKIGRQSRKQRCEFVYDVAMIDDPDEKCERNDADDDQRHHGSEQIA